METGKKKETNESSLKVKGNRSFRLQVVSPKACSPTSESFHLQVVLPKAYSPTFEVVSPISRFA